MRGRAHGEAEGELLALGGGAVVALGGLREAEVEVADVPG